MQATVLTKPHSQNSEGAKIREIREDVYKRQLYKNDLMMLEMLAQCNWTRPLYVALTVGEENTISEAMRRSGLVSSEDTPVAEATQANVEEAGSEDEYSCGVPSKPSHLDFGKSTISEADLPKMVKLGYFSEAKKELIRLGGEESIPKPGKDEVVVFKSFLKAGLRFPLNKMIAIVLKKFGIYLHQLTPNAIVRLSVYIWALRSQGWNRSVRVSAEFMNYATRLKLEEMVCTKILAATTLLIARLRSFQ